MVIYGKAGNNTNNSFNRFIYWYIIIYYTVVNST